MALQSYELLSYDSSVVSAKRARYRTSRTSCIIAATQSSNGMPVESAMRAMQGIGCARRTGGMAHPVRGDRGQYREEAREVGEAVCAAAGTRG